VVFAAWAEVMIGAMIIIVKVKFSFDGDHRKMDVINRKGIPQMQKTMK